MLAAHFDGTNPHLPVWVAAPDVKEYHASFIGQVTGLGFVPWRHYGSEDGNLFVPTDAGIWLMGAAQFNNLIYKATNNNTTWECNAGGFLYGPLMKIAFAEEGMEIVQGQGGIAVERLAYASGTRNGNVHFESTCYGPEPRIFALEDHFTPKNDSRHPNALTIKQRTDENRFFSCVPEIGGSEVRRVGRTWQQQSDFEGIVAEWIWNNAGPSVRKNMPQRQRPIQEPVIK